MASPGVTRLGFLPEQFVGIVPGWLIDAAEKTTQFAR